MTEHTVLILVILATMIIIILSGYALLLKKKIALKKTDNEPVSNANLKQTAEVLDSIRLLATTAINGELKLSEACIRIAALSDSLKMSDVQKQRYLNIYKLAGETYNIPRNQSWKDLPKEQRQQLSDKMTQLESNLKDTIIAELTIAVKAIGDNTFI